MHLDGWEFRETILSIANLKDMPRYNKPGGSLLFYFCTSEKTLSKWSRRGTAWLERFGLQISGDGRCRNDASVDARVTLGRAGRLLQRQPTNHARAGVRSVRSLESQLGRFIFVLECGVALAI